MYYTDIHVYVYVHTAHCILYCIICLLIFENSLLVNYKGQETEESEMKELQYLHIRSHSIDIHKAGPRGGGEIDSHAMVKCGFLDIYDFRLFEVLHFYSSLR